jgi:hypothetical protein
MSHIDIIIIGGMIGMVYSNFKSSKFLADQLQKMADQVKKLQERVGILEKKEKYRK